jgi:hypothetical protein
MLRELLFGEERLAVAVAAHDVGAVVDDAVPEEGGDVTKLRVAGQLVLAGRADDFRELRVGVQPAQRILAARQRIEDRLVIERMGDAQIVGVAGGRVDIREHLVHAAEFGAEGALLLVLRQAVDAELHPVGHLRHHRERLRVAAQLVHVEQAGHDLVDGVVGRPHALPRVDTIEELFGERRQVAGVKPRRLRTLNLAELGHHQIATRLESRVTSRRIHQRKRREVVADGVAAQFDVGRLPSAERLRRRRQAGVDAEVVEQPIGIEAEQVLLIERHRLLERTVDSRTSCSGTRAPCRRPP